MEIILISICVINLALVILLLVNQNKAKSKDNSEELTQALLDIKRDINEEQRLLRSEIMRTTNESIKTLGEYIVSSLQISNQAQTDRISEVNKTLSEKQDTFLKTFSAQNAQQEQRFNTFALENEQKLDSIRKTVELKLSYIQEDNNKKLDEMRNIVDEKLQKTLEDRMTKSFQIVNERLEQVYKGLGEMQTLATGVGDLKKVLTNVKTRGILGEVQLGAILEEILAPEQYATNIATKKGSKNVVEYAVKIPADNGVELYLPIDSKFPGDTYSKLMEAYEDGNAQDIAACVKALLATIKAEAKDIKDKYIDPPNTTDFAIMFLPFEGLYAEVVKRGMVEVLQRDYHINIAGPSTMAALLNSLQMGFRSFAIQKRSSEVWAVLGGVKTEFDKFGNALQTTQNRLKQATDEIEKLVGVRTRAIQRKLRSVESIPESPNINLLDGFDEE